MNKERVTIHNNYIQSDQATYVMSSTFRIRDNHGLYYVLTNYKTIHFVIYRNQEEQKRNNDFFDQNIPSLLEILQRYGTTTVEYREENLFKNLSGDIILDKGYLKQEKKLESSLILFASQNNRFCVSIESNIVVPVETTSNKVEYSARTIRPKIWKVLHQFLDPVLEEYPVTKQEQNALNVLQEFITNKLPYYNLKNHPEFEYSSSLSPYLKYGFISPVRILKELELSSNDKDSFIEELVVRRELAINLVYFNESYDSFEDGIDPWAKQTMMIHQYDKREYLYTKEDYIHFNTHDPYFNAAMKEMVCLGKMHGYMRMYWCKKIIEWSRTYKEAFETALYLNNYYFLDGNTPNGYTGVLWCFGKHDRAWSERNIFGKLRYMNENGLKRKFDIDEYIKRINQEVKKNGTCET